MSLTNFDNFQPMNEKLNKSDVKYSMEMAFANQGGNWYKALKRVDVKGDKIKLNMSSYMGPGEILQKIVDEFNDIMLTDFRINKESFQKGSVTSIMLEESINEEYEFSPSEAARRLKDREKENIQRYRAAQEREDNYAIALYELKIKLDKMDLERLKVQTAIHDLKKKNGR